MLTDGGEPKSYEEALQDKNLSKWELVMKYEMDSLSGNQKWELTEGTVQKRGEEDKENVNSQVDLSTPVAEVCRSS